MDYILIQRVLNIIKLQLWHKSNRRICIRGYMICCDKCNEAYMNEFSGYLCLRIFFKYKGYNCSRDIVPNLKNLVFSYSLNDFELDLIINILKNYYNVSIYKNKQRIKLEERD